MEGMFADGAVLGARKISLVQRFLQVMQMVAICWTLLSSALKMWEMKVAADSPLHFKLGMCSVGCLFVAVSLYSVILPLMYFRKDWERLHPE